MSDDVLLFSFTITRVLNCIADPTKNRVIARFSGDVSPAFPYLNAVVPNLIYNPEANSITVKRGERILTFYPDGAAIAKVDGAEDALAQLRWFQDLCNEVWRRRAEITPCYQRRNLLGPLDAYRLLPRLNCGDCGEPTCMAFAAALLQGNHHLDECPHLWEEAFIAGGRQLAEALGV
ncbi:MAG: Fe-S cluster protein [Anaerolineae bacterium]|nr:Fe-S cluster protein [Anaerolineae bacterium]